MMGFLFVVILIAASFYYQFKYHNKLPQTTLLYDENGKLLGAPPFSPSEVPPFGTDRSGFNMGIKLLIGAKWTLGAAILIAFVRMGLAFILGLLYGNYLFRFKRIFTAIVDSLTVIPLTLFAYIVLSSVLVMDSFTSTFKYPLWERAGFEGLFLAVAVVPVVSVLIGNEIGTLYKNEYIDSARILGGSRLHLFCHHILPHLLPKLFVIFVQQIIQVMIIIGHLGFLGLLFGGTMKFQPGMALLSSTQEWAGLIGVNNNIQSISIYPWLVMGPIIMMTLGIIAFNFMLVGLQKALEANKVVKLKRGVRLEGTVNKDLRALEPFSFVTPRIDES